MFLWTLALCVASTLAAVPMPSGSFMGYFSNEEIEEYANALHKRRPMFVSAPFVIGHSIEGRNITAFCVGNCKNENTPSVLYTALIHSREPMSMANLVYFIEHLFHGESGSHRLRPETRAMLSARQLWFILNLNPDGYHYNYVNSRNGCGDQRKNARASCPRAHKNHNLRSNNQGTIGVDLNRNFRVCFDHDNVGSSTKGCGEDYRGTAPFSEPEAQALKNFVEHHNLSIALNYHSFGRYINIPHMCKSEGDVSVNDKKWYHDFSVEATRATKWGYGHPWDSYYYTVNGDVSDWMYNEHGINAMAPEMGPGCETCKAISDCEGFWPSQREIVPLSSETLPMNTMAADLAGAMLRLTDIRFSHEGAGRCKFSARVWNRGTRATRGVVTVVVRDSAQRHLSAVKDLGSLKKYQLSYTFTVTAECAKAGRRTWVRVRDKDHCVEYKQDDASKQFLEYIWVNCRANSKNGKNPVIRSSRLMQGEGSLFQSSQNGTAVRQGTGLTFFNVSVLVVAGLVAVPLFISAALKLYRSMRYRQAVSRLHSYDTAAEVVSLGFKDAMDHRMAESRWEDSWEETDLPTTSMLRNPDYDFDESDFEDSL